MYENLIQRQPLSNKPSNLSVRLSAMPVSEQVAYVESVCAALIDARFGRRMTPFLIEFRELPEHEDEGFCDLTFDGMVSCYTFFSDFDMPRRDAAAVIRRELSQSRSLAAAAPALHRASSNLARGSPRISRGRIVECQYHLRSALSVPPAVAGG